VSSSPSRIAAASAWPGATASRRRRGWIGAAVLILVVVGGWLAARGLPTRRAQSPIRLGRRAPVSVERGLELDPALSPDGKLVAYAAANGSLTVRQVEGGSPVQVVHAPDS